MQTGNIKRLILIVFIAAVSIVSFVLYAKTREDYNKPFFNNAQLDTVKNAASGFFSHIRFADKAIYLGDLSFQDSNGNTQSLKDYKDQVLLVNLWATWCVPCRQEIPQLVALAQDKAGQDFSVVLINSLDKKDEADIRRVMNEYGANDFPYYKDSDKSAFNSLRANGLAMGLPLTLLLDRQHYLVASFNGAAPWGDEDSQRMIQTLIDYQHQERAAPKS